MVLAEHEKNSSKGLVEFRNCIAEDTTYAGVLVRLKTATSIKVKFSNCKWQNVARRRSTIPIHLTLKRKKFITQTEGVEFNNCYVYDQKKRSFLWITDLDDRSGVHDIKGEITIYNPYGARIDSRISKEKLGLKINSLIPKHK